MENNKITMPFVCVCVCLWKEKELVGRRNWGMTIVLRQLYKISIHLLLLFSSNSYKSVYGMKMCDFRFKINIR